MILLTNVLKLCPQWSGSAYRRSDWVVFENGTTVRPGSSCGVYNHQLQVIKGIEIGKRRGTCQNRFLVTVNSTIAHMEAEFAEHSGRADVHFVITTRLGLQATTDWATPKCFKAARYTPVASTSCLGGPHHVAMHRQMSSVQLARY